MNIFWNLTSQRRAESARKPSVVKSYCHTLPILIELPIELVSEIVSRLSFEDLLNLRASSRALDTLIREDGLLKPWVKRHVRPIQAQFSPVPSLQLWNHILKQERSWSLVQNTASIMVNYINRKVLLSVEISCRDRNKQNSVLMLSQPSLPQDQTYRPTNHWLSRRATEPQESRRA